MSYVAVRWLSAGTTALAAAMLLTSCAVGPDFVHPAAPEITRYTREPLAAQTRRPMSPPASASISSKAATFRKEWWTLFKSPALNALIERCAAQQSQSAIGAGDAARRARKPSTRRKANTFRWSQANFNPTRAADVGVAVAGACVRRQHLQSLYRAGAGVVHVRRLGPQSAHGRIARRRSPTCSVSRSRRPISH